MKKKIFEQFQQLIYEKSGISLNEKKETLLSSRISKRIKKLNLASEEEYMRYILERDESEMLHLLDAITTNVTHFFREPIHYDFLRKALLQSIGKHGLRKVRIWSAGCSSGEEPFSIAMVLLDLVVKFNLDLKILATDISSKILTQCIRGGYSHEKIKKIAPEMLQRHFDFDSGEDIYIVKSNIRSMVTFSRLNLSDVPFPMKGPFDFIFCRNVMIYFDSDMRNRLIGEFSRLLKSEGILFVGQAESLNGLDHKFNVVKPSIYEKVKHFKVKDKAL